MSKFKKIDTKIKGLYAIEPIIHKDNRGFFFESYNYDEFKKIGIDNIFIQDSHSKSSKGVLRGLHFQKGKFAQAKLIRVIKGAILDVAVDLRKESDTFGKWEKILLDSKTNKMFFIPRGFAHGFLTLEDETEILYKCDNIYSPESEGSIIWNDDDLNIDWCFREYNIDANEVLLSEKDKLNKKFKMIKGEL